MVKKTLKLFLFLYKIICEKFKKEAYLRRIKVNQVKN